MNGTLPALAALRDAGLAWHIGITVLQLKIYRSVLDLAPPGAVDVTLSYCHYASSTTPLPTLYPTWKRRALG